MAKVRVELKKELLAKYLVKEKEIAAKFQKLLKSDKNEGRNDTASMKKSIRKKDRDRDSAKEKNIIKDQREDEVDYLDSLSNTDLGKMIIINEKFVFSFLDFIARSTTYVSRSSKVIVHILGLFDLEFLAFLLSRRYIKIKYRTIVIKFIHEI